MSPVIHLVIRLLALGTLLASGHPLLIDTTEAHSPSLLR